MAYNVTITYKGPEAEGIKDVCSICNLFKPTGSYADTEAYAGTVYDTNVEGWGKIDLMEPYASTSFPFPTPLAQFKLAVIGEDVKDEDGNVIGKKVSFTVDDYKEAFWYKQVGAALANQGFEVVVEEESAAS